MPEINENKIAELISEIRGTKPDDKIKDDVTKIIEADKKIAEEKKTKEDQVKKGVDEQINKLKEDALADDKKKLEKAEKKKKEKKNEKSTGEEEEENSDEDEEDEVEKLTKKMKEMTKEIDALKKRKNYRTKPPKTKKTDKLDDLIKQNTQIMQKDFEVYI